jgi:succinoglycan biosynthesis protein ExoM
MPDVVVAIPTYRRPKGLERLLDALENLETDARVAVLVADNDAARREGSEVCARVLEGGYRWPLEVIIVPERGIAQARNALVEHALAHSATPFIAMLDDDEWPEPAWLDEFLRVQTETDADALHGAVLRDFESAPGVWAARCAGIAPLRGRTGSVAMIHGTSNVLLRRAVLESMAKPCFDPGFALTGGEDKDFFTRLRGQGARFAWADDAIVHDQVPASRANLHWALRRAYRVGNSDMRVFLKTRPRTQAIVLESAKILGALLLSPVMFAILAAVPNRRVEALCKLWRAAGKTAAIFGAHYNEYATTHGG